MTAPKVDLGKELEIPDLELPAPQQPRVSSPMAGGSNPPASTRTPTKPAPPVRGDARALEIDNSGDDWDMEIERESAALASLTSAAPTRQSSPSYRRMAPVASTGLDVAYDRRQTFERDAAAYEPSKVGKIVGSAVAVALALATVIACVKLAHRAGGRDITSMLPHAFDATSAPQSGIVAGGMLILAIAIGTAGIYLRPRSWTIVASGGPMLLMALAMVTVALTATEEHPAPPDGARLIPYLVPLSILILGVGMVRRAARGFFAKEGARRMVGLPLALIAGALFFVAIETSRFASSLP